MSPVVADIVMDTGTILLAQIAVIPYFLTAVRVSNKNDRKLNPVICDSQ